MKIDELSINKVQLLLVGLSIIVVDLVGFYILLDQGDAINLAYIASFLLSAVILFLSSFAWLPQGSNLRQKRGWLIKFIVVTLMMLFLQGGILSCLIKTPDFSLQLAIIFCVIISSMLYFVSIVGVLYLEFYSTKSTDKWCYFFVWVLIYSIILRFSYLGVPELFYEEAYYWNYAKHLDIGYLDHPPMVAWIIALFTKLMGDNEFAVRFGAFICWFVTSAFLYKLTSLVYCNKTKSVQAVLLIAVLPAYFAVGWAMTPDAPLVACWAMALYFFYRALVHESRMAWIGVGLAIGLGMLSKYTIALLSAAAFSFMLIDRDARKWLVRPEPYVAVVISLIIFFPVIIWNANHEWVSFLYQSRGRVADRFEFSLPYLIGTTILIITPTGFLSVIAILLYRKAILSGSDAVFDRSMDMRAKRGYNLLMLLTLLPVSVFVVLSLFRETKFHWTAPCWLGIVPYMALTVSSDSQFGLNKHLGWIQRAWPTTIIICLLIYGAFLSYLGLGFPGISYPYNYHLLGWNDFGREIETLANRLEHETGEKILVVGMDRNRVASGLAFYRTKAIESANEKLVSHPAFETSSWHLFGGNGLMYERWFPLGRQNDKTLLLVGRNRADLTSESVLSHMEQVQEIKEIKVRKNGQQVGLYYYRVAKGYRSQPVIDKNPAHDQLTD
ncbi:MAG: glycosyltransferase family 39 protein [Candidatus Competibacteraceae bacterium]|nr:glycosyltransferase family 39 protein [Candidatus Competibacteraceae bacterium]